jgi:hypothetical protein
MAINDFDRTSLEETQALGKYYGIEGYETMTHEDLLNAIDATSAINEIFDISGTDLSGNYILRPANLKVVRDLCGNYIMTFS